MVETSHRGYTYWNRKSCRSSREQSVRSVPSHLKLRTHLPPTMPESYDSTCQFAQCPMSSCRPYAGRKPRDVTLGSKHHGSPCRPTMTNLAVIRPTPPFSLRSPQFLILQEANTGSSLSPYCRSPPTNQTAVLPPFPSKLEQRTEPAPGSSADQLPSSIATRESKMRDSALAGLG